jgi:putative membrane protein insertion efficiency factor
MTKRSRVPALMLGGLLFVTAGCTLHDATVDVPKQWGTRIAVFSIEQYRHYGSPRMRSAGVQCRFTPTCSLYGLESVKKYGLLKGGWRAAARITRCRGSVPLGTVDLP